MVYLPARQLWVFRNYMAVARKVASRLLEEASREICSGQSNRRDVMSLMGTCRAYMTLFHEASQVVSPSDYQSGPQTRDD